jgi:glycosyltransferase involved in cell wall biosynthesis
LLKDILIDAREFRSDRLTGIGRVLLGLIDSLANCQFVEKIILATGNVEIVPFEISQLEKVETIKIPQSFVRSELALTQIAKKETRLFISPYPKFPFTGISRPAINMVHDVFFITHPAYKKNRIEHIGRIRLKSALKKADLTWFVSNHSKQETGKLVGFTGNNPKVRYSGIDSKFNNLKSEKDGYVLNKHKLAPGYILVVGNGKPHKNLGILLQISKNISRKIVFVGVSETAKNYWLQHCSESNAKWISHIGDEELPAIIRSSFCLAQPSTAEGYGLPPIEAIACGIPAVVSNISVLIETTGGKALTADPYDPETWMKAFHALENENLYESQTVAGLKWVEHLKSNKGWINHINDIKKFFEISKV